MIHIKICGITNLSDAVAAVDAGADMLGFNFFPSSPRSINPSGCAEITSYLLKEYPHITLVGVFVNMPILQARNIMERCSLHLAQLHGDETPEMLAAFNGQAYKAFRGIPDKSIYTNYLAVTPNKFPGLLLDASINGLYGGSGVTTDWAAAAGLARKFPILLAGGLKPENVADALLRVRPWGVDTASGVEIAPGTKDANKMKAFVKMARSATL